MCPPRSQNLVTMQADVMNSLGALTLDFETLT